MESVNGGTELPQQLKPTHIPIFSEGISLILSRWTALQMAIANEWGGRLSSRKAELLASEILSFFTKSKDPLYIDDLEELLFANTRDHLNMMVEDGSIEEVAEELMILHEELLHDDLKSMEKLRNSRSASDAISKSKAMNEDNDESSSDEASDMAVDELTPRLDSKSEAMPAGEPKQHATVEAEAEAEAEDGWSVVSSRRNKGKRH